MEPSRSPEIPEPAPGKSKSPARKKAMGRQGAKIRPAYSPGQLHLLCELLGEFAVHLEGGVASTAQGLSLALHSEVPHLTAFIEHQLDVLRGRQEKFERLYLGFEGR